MKENKMDFLEKPSKFYKDYGQFSMIILVPLLAAIIPLCIQTQAASCAFVAIIMSFYWITEYLPIAVTSLLPVVMYPLLGIMSSEKISIEYFKDIIMLFFGGLVVASAIEITRLHERLALIVLMCFGSHPQLVLLGFMLSAGFMSLWISNTATASMMLPIMIAVVRKLVKYDKAFHKSKSIKESDEVTSIEKSKDKQTVKSNAEPPVEIELTDRKTTDDVENQVSQANESDANAENTNDQDFEENENARKLKSGYLIALAYASNIGGMGSLVGTTPNIILKGYYDQNYPEAKLDFLTYMLYALPVSIILEFLAWIWLSFLWLPRSYFFRFRCGKKNKVDTTDDSDRHADLTEIVKKNYKELGPTRWEEKCVAVIFGLLVFLWIARDLRFAPGWAYFFKENFPTDSTPAIIAVLLLFICPKNNIFKGKPYNHLIEWKKLQNVFPWNVMLLLGGSLALAKGFEASGLSDWIGSQLKLLDLNSKELTTIIVQIITQLTTEFTSNSSVEAIFLPIIDKMSKEIRINATYLLVPMTLSTSMAFLFPVATPPNAVVFSTGDIRIKDMVISGIVMKIIGLVVIFASSNLWLGLIFNLNYPSTTSTMPVNSTLSYY